MKKFLAKLASWFKPSKLDTDFPVDRPQRGTYLQWPQGKLLRFHHLDARNSEILAMPWGEVQAAVEFYLNKKPRNVSWRPDAWDGNVLTFPEGWYFEDETSDLHGPFKSMDEAEAGMMVYCEQVLGSKPSVVGLGTPAHRLSRLLDELAERFPDAHDPVMSDPPEPKYLAAIDAILPRTRPPLDELGVRPKG